MGCTRKSVDLKLTLRNLHNCSKLFELYMLTLVTQRLKHSEEGWRHAGGGHRGTSRTDSK